MFAAEIGEAALFGKKPVRRATVTADVEKTEALVLSRKMVGALVREGHLDRQWAARMKTVFDGR